MAAAFPAVGDEFGRYRIIGELGRGGMGVVFEATDTTLSRRIALKILNPVFASDPDYRDRFAREAATLARLDSPVIVHIYDYGEHDGCLFLVTQLLTGGDLAQHLANRGPLSTSDAQRITVDICEALADAHDAGIVHRDVKPSNVFLRTRSGRLSGLLGDFGIATSEVDGHVTKTGTVVGSTAYMAPERHRGGRADERADIYSAGCLLWMALTGRAPYAGTDVEVAMAHLGDPVPQLADGRPGQAALNGVLARSLAKDPSARFASAGEMAEALRAIRAESAPTPEAPAAAPVAVPEPSPATAPATALRPTTAPQPTDTPRSRTPLLIGAGVVVLALVAGGTALALRGGGDPKTADGSKTPTTAPTASAAASAMAASVATGLRQSISWGLEQGQATCLGNALVHDLGPDRLEKSGILAANNQSPQGIVIDITEADAKAYANAVTGCHLTAEWAAKFNVFPEGPTDYTAANTCIEKTDRDKVVSELTTAMVDGGAIIGPVDGCVRDNS